MVGFVLPMAERITALDYRGCLAESVNLLPLQGGNKAVEANVACAVGRVVFVAIEPTAKNGTRKRAAVRSGGGRAAQRYAFERGFSYAGYNRFDSDGSIAPPNRVALGITGWPMPQTSAQGPMHPRPKVP